jgi:hypothetical protein
MYTAHARGGASLFTPRTARSRFAARPRGSFVRFPRRNSSLSMASFLKPIEWVLGNFSVDMGIDLGTANTLVCVKEQGIILSEPSVVAVKKGTNEVLLDGNAVGLQAKEMLGRTPGNIVAIRPLKNGVIADFEITEKMLSHFIRKAHNRNTLVRPRIIIGIPSEVTQVEKRAVKDSALKAKASEVYLVDQAMASARHKYLAAKAGRAGSRCAAARRGGRSAPSRQPQARRNPSRGPARDPAARSARRHRRIRSRRARLRASSCCAR